MGGNGQARGGRRRHPCNDEQRRQCPPGMCHRVRSGITHKMPSRYWAISFGPMRSTWQDSSSVRGVTRSVRQASMAIFAWRAMAASSPRLIRRAVTCLEESTRAGESRWRKLTSRHLQTCSCLTLPEKKKPHAPYPFDQERRAAAGRSVQAPAMAGSRQRWCRRRRSVRPFLDHSK
jgi:hypothetical protein